MGGEVTGRLITTSLVCALIVTACGHPSQPPPSSAAAPAPAPIQSVVPFTGLNGPYEVAVDAGGNVFVSDIAGGRSGSNRVIELAAGSNTQRLLPFTRAKVMSDPSGRVWVIDGGHDPSRLVKLGHDAEQQAVLPTPELGREYRGIIHAVDAAGGVYGMIGGGEVGTRGCCLPVQVAKQSPGSNTPTVLPFPRLTVAAGMAVDAGGNLYVGDGNGKRVLKLAPGASNPSELPFHGLRSVIDIAVDAKGAVYVVEGQQHQILKLDPGSNTPTVLPFSGLTRPISVAIDPRGGVYVVDDGDRRVVKQRESDACTKTVDCVHQ